LGSAGLNQWSKEGGDVREITGKRENKLEVGESKTKSVVRRPRCKRDNWKERK
jgi:hypothetical protein